MINSLLGAFTASVVSSATKSIAVAAVEGLVTYAEMKEKDNKMKHLDMVMRENPKDYIQMSTEKSDLINQDFRDIVNNLAAMGFYNINIKEVYVRKGLFESDRTGLVTDVSINGARSFDSMSVFSKDSYVIVEAVIHGKDAHLYMPELEDIRKGAALYQRPVKKCSYCGIVVEDGQKYCICCGAPL